MAAISVVLVGAAIVTAIIANDPRWRPIIAAGRETSSTWSAKVWVLARMLAERTPWPTQNGAAAALGESRSGPIPPKPVPSKPTQPRDETRLAGRSPSAASDTTQIMVSLLIAELGAGPAWRTAITNAESHAPDSPEFVYWQRVAAAIRDGGTRPRP